MYNRYIPTENGTYRCNRVEEWPVSVPPKPADAPPEPPCPPPPPPPPPPQPPQPCREESSLFGHGFLKRLLPRNLDMGDLLILLIVLLLMTDSDDGDDSLTVLLTIAAFLILQ